MTITLAAGYPQGPGNATATSFTKAVTVVNNGDLFVVCTIIGSSTVTVTSITDTSSRITWHGSATAKEVDAGTGNTAEEWYGVATSTGTTTITVNFSASATGEFEVWELHESVGGLTWSVVASGNKPNTSSTTVTYPPLTSAASGDQAYIGLAGIQNSDNGGALPAGFTDASTPGGNQIMYDVSLATGTLFSPTAAQSPAGTSDAVGAIFTATSGASVVPVHVTKVQRFPLRRRGFSLFRKGPITPVPQPPKVVSKPVQSNIWHRVGRRIVFQGPVNPVPQPPKVVSKPHKAGRGRIIVLRGPINPVPIPPQVVSRPHRAGRGRIWVFQGPVPAAPVVVPLAPVVVLAPHRLRRGQVHLFQGPVNPVPIPPQVVSPPHRARRGRVLVLRGPVNPVPIIPLVVSPPHRAKPGRIRLFQGPVNPVAVPPKIVSRPPPPRRGRLVVLRGPVPAVIPALPPPPVVSKPHRAKPGRILVFRGPVNPVPVPHQVVSKPPAPRRGRRLFFRGTTPAPVVVPPAQTIISKVVHRLLRGRLFFWQGPVTLVPPPVVVIPTEFTAGPPQPYWVTSPPRSWWETGQPQASRWEVGEPTGAWAATQAIWEATNADNASSNWQTGEPRN